MASIFGSLCSFFAQGLTVGQKCFKEGVLKGILYDNDLFYEHSSITIIFLLKVGYSPLPPPPKCQIWPHPWHSVPANAVSNSGSPKN